MIVMICYPAAIGTNKWVLQGVGVFTSHVKGEVYGFILREHL